MLGRDALLVYRNKLFEAENERFAEFMATKGVAHEDRSLSFDKYAHDHGFMVPVDASQSNSLRFAAETNTTDCRP
jgi:hypothetical protein